MNQSDPTQFSGGRCPAITYDGGAMYTDWIAVADLNGDGVPDLVVSNRCAPSACGESGPVSVLLGNGDGTSKEPWTIVRAAPGRVQLLR